VYGTHALPFSITNDEITLTFRKEDEFVRYSREYTESHYSKLTLTNVDERTLTKTKYYEDKECSALLFAGDELFIHPIEPLNKPLYVSNYLEISFNEKVVIFPKAQERIYLTFPVEIGVFVPYRKKEKLIDIITFSRQKYTLYGPLNQGYICRYWESDVNKSVPKCNPLAEGIIELSIKNDTGETLEVSKAIFNSPGMKIYFKDDLVSMKASMKLISRTLAETGFKDEPLKKGMKKAVEFYPQKNIPMVSKKMLMEWGI
jgi:hypothetical protein